MPSAQEIKKKKTKGPAGIKAEMKMPKAKTGSTRRPNGTKPENQEILDEVVNETVEVDLSAGQSTEICGEVTDVAAGSNHSDKLETEGSTEEPEVKKTKKPKKLQIPNFIGLSMGAQLLKSQFPKSFGFAEKVVEDWVNEGSFNELPIETPIVQYYVGEGFRRVKGIEKKIETKLDDAGILPIVKHQLGRVKKYINKK